MTSEIHSIAAGEAASGARRSDARERVILRRARERRARLVDERKREALRRRGTAHVDELARDAHREAAVNARLVALCTNAHSVTMAKHIWIACRKRT